jgi:hypothetical protein
MTYYYSIECHRAHIKGTTRPQHTRCRLECPHLKVDELTRTYYCDDPKRIEVEKKEPRTGWWQKLGEKND